MDACHGSLLADFGDHSPAIDSCDPPPPAQAESELQFYARRAQEESRLAKQASSARAAAAHSYLAAAYSAAIARELGKQRELEELLLRLD